MALKLTFGMIVFNGESLLPTDMLKLCILNVYEIAHEIIIVEGATKAVNHYFDGDASSFTNTGKSTDNTLAILKSIPDPKNKITIIESNGFWDGKTSMCNAYAKVATGDYIWQLDSDEFYHQSDMLKIKRLLEIERPNAVYFFANHFFGGFDYCIDERSAPQWGNDMSWRRIFRHVPGKSHWLRHEPPTYICNGQNCHSGKIINREQTLELGIKLYHYSNVEFKQVEFKRDFFKNSVSIVDAWNLFEKDKSYRPLGSPVFPFTGHHPEIISRAYNLLNKPKKTELEITWSEPVNKVEEKLEYDTATINMGYHTTLLTYDSGNTYIRQLLQSPEPFMVARMGIGEVIFCNYYLQRKFNNISYPVMFKQQAHFFPTDDISFDKFAKHYLESLNDVDLIVSIVSISKNKNWIAAESNMLRQFGSLKPIAHPWALEPFLCNNTPWSKALAGKKVLILLPFPETVKQQYQKRDKLFKNSDLLPQFEIKTYKPIFSLAGVSNEHASWLDALKYMQDDIAKIDFDVALIAAGAYGLPLSAFVKSIGKQAIHVAGGLQLLFGIKGARWLNMNPHNTFFNEHWERPMTQERPPQFHTLEGGCYW